MKKSDHLHTNFILYENIILKRLRRESSLSIEDDVKDELKKIKRMYRKVDNFEKDLKHINDCSKEGKKIVLSCVVFDDDDNAIDRLYYISDYVEGARVLGEIELFKRDIVENLVLGDDEIDSYENFGNN